MAKSVIIKEGDEKIVPFDELSPAQFLMECLSGFCSSLTSLKLLPRRFPVMMKLKIDVGNITRVKVKRCLQMVMHKLSQGKAYLHMKLSQ